MSLGRILGSLACTAILFYQHADAANCTEGNCEAAQGVSGKALLQHGKNQKESPISLDQVDMTDMSLEGRTLRSKLRVRLLVESDLRTLHEAA